MRFAKNPAFLLALALVCAAVLIPAAVPAEGSSRFAGPWYAVSCVMDGKEYYPETWDEPLVITLGADGRFTWIGQFYDDYFGTWYCLNDSELHLLIDNEDGTPGTEEDASILMLNQEHCSSILQTLYIGSYILTSVISMTLCLLFVLQKRKHCKSRIQERK